MLWTNSCQLVETTYQFDFQGKFYLLKSINKDPLLDPYSLEIL